MSYCHLVQPGSYTNISLSFGTGHRYGVNAYRVADVMRQTAQTYLPADQAAPDGGAAEFVKQQYRDLFDRESDPDGLNYWVAELHRGVGRAEVVERLMADPAFSQRYGPLVRLYSAYLTRLPDYAGLMYWLDAMYPLQGSGRTLFEVSEAFSHSQEFRQMYGALDNTQFVQLVYRNVHGRAADPGGLAYWVGRLGAGMTRGAFMVGVSESGENIGRQAASDFVTLTYAGLLRRMPSPAEHGWWMSELEFGRTTGRSMIAAALASDEYANRFR